MAIARNAVAFLDLARRAGSWKSVHKHRRICPKQQLLAVLWREHDMVVAIPCRMVQVVLIL
jgi:hypothetical protein